jgi:hypothetical protein
MTKLTKREYELARSLGRPTKRTKRGFWLMEAKDGVAVIDSFFRRGMR